MTATKWPVDWEKRADEALEKHAEMSHEDFIREAKLILARAYSLTSVKITRLQQLIALKINQRDN